MGQEPAPARVVIDAALASRTGLLQNVEPMDRRESIQPVIEDIEFILRVAPTANAHEVAEPHRAIRLDDGEPAQFSAEIVHAGTHPDERCEHLLEESYSRCLCAERVPLFKCAQEEPTIGFGTCPALRQVDVGAVRQQKIKASELVLHEPADEAVALGQLIDDAQEAWLQVVEEAALIAQ